MSVKEIKQYEYKCDICKVRKPESNKMLPKEYYSFSRPDGTVVGWIA